MSVNDNKVSAVEITNYVIRDYNETKEVEQLKSVAPYRGVDRKMLICHYGFKSVLNALSELRMQADDNNKHFYEVSIKIDAGKLVAGRIGVEQLENTSALNMSYINLEIKKHIEEQLGYRLNRHKTGMLMLTPDEVERIHNMPMFNHLDVIIFPGVTNEPTKPDSYAALFYPDNVLEVKLTNPNKGAPFDVELPELHESPMYAGV